MFYAHTEGRRWGIPRAIAYGLRAATFNIMYPPSLDEVDAAQESAFEMTVNPQSFRLPYGVATWPPRVAEFLKSFGTTRAHDIADFDAYDTPRELNQQGYNLCDRLWRLQEDFGATEMIAPYFLSAGPDDAYFELSILCAQYLAETHPDRVIFTGIMMDGSALRDQHRFEQLANRVTSPDTPSPLYFDFDFGLPKSRPLRDIETLDRLKALFDATQLADKYSLLARCNSEGLVLQAGSGLSAFSISYYQSERRALHRTLDVEYEAPGIQRAPTPHLFSPTLLTDVPRDVAQAMAADGHRKWLICPCGACAEVLRTNFGSGAGGLCPAHFYSCMSDLDLETENQATLKDQVAFLLSRLDTAQRRANDVIAQSGTFAHLAKWSEWLKGLAP
jgi:hypothetical protein